ncbi:GMC family oxidoreductase [candidate division KSB1 bacterium]|nr:GMC family oxidoreductase [candidate division KSB1 bacterium]
MANKHVNAIVVGAGAGGGVVAKELAANGISVILFERGGWPVYDECINDELRNQRTFVLGSAFGPDWDRHPRVLLGKDGTKRIVVANGWDYSHIAACVGSGTVSYGAMAWRYMPEDFKMKTTYGSVAGSTLEDWPICYDELESCYEKAEWEIGVSGDDRNNPFAAPRQKPYPMPPFENTKEGTLLSAAARRLGLHPFPIPMLRNSVPYDGRPGCIRNRTCIGFQCPVDAKNGTHNTVIPAAMATGHCTVKTHCQVAEVTTGTKGRATGVRYFDNKDREQYQTADIVIIAASAIETARLLLNSRSKLFPNGISNESGWVGRNLQGHAYTGADGLFDHDVRDRIGPGATFGLCDFNHHNKGIIGGGLLCNEFHDLPYGFSQFRPPGAARWGKAHKEFQVKMYRRISAIRGPIQEMPNFEARITVDETVKDHWGIPVAALSGERHVLDHEHCKFLSARAEEIIREAGAYQTWKTIGGKGLSGSQHQCGTARMGNDPKTSVVNKYGQSHQVDNLFVADASLFVTGGGFNPVLTIMALGYHVGNYIVKNWNGSKFK